MASKIDEMAVRGLAKISKDERYRYYLERDLEDHPDSKVVFIMCNPSTADADVGDATIRKCMKFAIKWGYGKIGVLNLFAFRSTYPSELYKASDPIGPVNDAWIRAHCDPNSADWKPLVVCAWGEHGKFQNRGNEVLKTLDSMNVKPHYLVQNKSGQPKHPLYVRDETFPTEYDESFLRNL